MRPNTLPDFMRLSITILNGGFTFIFLSQRHAQDKLFPKPCQVLMNVSTQKKSIGKLNAGSKSYGFLYILGDNYPYV